MQRFQNPGNFSACRELGNLGFGIRNSAQGIRNSASDWNPESGIQYLKSEILSVESRIQRLSWITLLSLHRAKLNFNIVIK